MQLPAMIPHPLILIVHCNGLQTVREGGGRTV